MTTNVQGLDQSFSLGNETQDVNETIWIHNPVEIHSEISNEIDLDSNKKDEKNPNDQWMEEPTSSQKLKFDTVEDLIIPTRPEWLEFESKKKDILNEMGKSDQRLEKLIDSNISSEIDNNANDTIETEISSKNKSNDITLELNSLDSQKNISLKPSKEDIQNEKETDDDDLDATKEPAIVDIDVLPEMEHNENLVPQEDSVQKKGSENFETMHVVFTKTSLQYSTTEDSPYVSTTEPAESLNHNISINKKLQIEAEKENFFQEATTSMIEVVTNESKDFLEATNFTSETLPSANKDSRSLSENAATHFFEPLLPKAAGRTFHENVAASHNVVGDVETTSSKDTSQRSQVITIIAFCSITTLILVTFSLTICLKTFHRQHGTLDIEMQEQHCGKDNLDDEEAETKIKLLNPTPQLLPSVDSDD